MHFFADFLPTKNAGKNHYQIVLCYFPCLFESSPKNRKMKKERNYTALTLSLFLA